MDPKCNQGYDGMNGKWNSRRSPVMALNGIAASSQVKKKNQTTIFFDLL